MIEVSVRSAAASRSPSGRARNRIGLFSPTFPQLTNTHTPSGTEGIGRGIATRLAASDGAETVIIVGRNAEKTARAAAEIAAGAPAGHRIVPCAADLSRMSEVRRLANHVLSAYDRLDFLVSTTAVLSQTRVTTVEGMDLMLATNHLSRFLLVNLLADRLVASPGHGRVVLVSGAGAPSVVNFDDPNYTKVDWGFVTSLKANMQAHSLNDALCLGANERWGPAGLAVHVTFPGNVQTNGALALPFWFRSLFSVLMWPFRETAEQSGDSHARLLLTEQGARGGLWSFLGSRNREGTRIPATGVLADAAYLRRCWELSERLVAQATANGAAPVTATGGEASAAAAAGDTDTASRS